MAKIKTIINKCSFCGLSNGAVVGSGTDFQYKTTNQYFNWIECKNCNQLYINPLPKESELNKIYPNNIGNYSEFDPNKNIAFKIKNLLEVFAYKKIISKYKNATMLDIGCAAGNLLDLFKNNFKNITKFEGLDISESATRMAKIKGYRVINGTIEKIKLKNNFYDIIIMQQVIEHLHRPNRVIEKIYQALKKDGVLIMETPNINCFDRKIFKGLWEGYHIPRHFNLWPTKNMVSLLEQTGFKSNTFKLISKPVHWTMSIENYLIKNKYPIVISKLFSLKNRFPIFLIFFGIIDFLNLKIFKKSSGVRYISIK